MSERPLRLGISTCLLGERVRHDGGHKRDTFLTEVLGEFFEWITVCPEVEIGMGTPREPVRLERDGPRVRMIGVKTATEWTSQMEGFSNTKLQSLEDQDLSGYVFKSRSPSCGLGGVAISGTQEGGPGMFASAVTRHFPLLPVEEESRLADPARRQSFIERVFAYRRLQDFFAKRRTAGQVVMFNSQHRLQLRSHSVSGKRELSRLVSDGNSYSWSELKARYGTAFMNVLERPTSRHLHANVLRSVRGHIASRLTADDLRETDEAIAEFAVGRVHLLIPLTLLRHHVRTTNDPWLKGQTYLEPHPYEHLLRSRM